MLVDVARLEREYYERKPELDDAEQLVAFGTSGHRGSPFRGSFYQVGSFAGDAWQEWNGKFRDDVRRFARATETSLQVSSRRAAGRGARPR